MFNTQGLKPAPWLENVCLTPHIQLKYHMPRTKRQRQLKKDREASSELVQPELVMDQLDQLLEDIDQNDFPFLVCIQVPTDFENIWMYIHGITIGLVKPKINA